MLGNNGSENHEKAVVCFILDFLYSIWPIKKSEDGQCDAAFKAVHIMTDLL